MIGSITSSRSRGLLFEEKFSFQRSAVGSVIDGIVFKTEIRDSVVPKHANFKPKKIFFLDLCIQSNSVDYPQILTAVVHLSFMYVFILIFVNPRVPPSKSLKPRANGSNIVGHQLPTLLDVTCCVRLHTPSVACCCAKFETGQTLSYVQTDAIIPNIAGQQCWELLCPFARSLKYYFSTKAIFCFTSCMQFKYGYRKYALERL